MSKQGLDHAKIGAIAEKVGREGMAKGVRRDTGGFETRLNREVEDLTERHQGIEAKAYTAEIVAASELARQGSQLTVIEPASLPTRPTGAPRSIIVMAGTFVFGCLGLMLALGLALIDDRITGRYDIERLEIVPVLVEIPKPEGSKRSA